MCFRFVPMLCSVAYQPIGAYAPAGALQHHFTTNSVSGKVVLNLEVHFAIVGKQVVLRQTYVVYQRVGRLVFITKHAAHAAHHVI